MTGRAYDAPFREVWFNPHVRRARACCSPARVDDRHGLPRAHWAVLCHLDPHDADTPHEYVIVLRDDPDVRFAADQIGDVQRLIAARPELQLET